MLHTQSWFARTWSQYKAEALKIKLVSFYVVAFRNNFYFCCYTSTTGRCYICKNENLYIDEVLAVLDDVDVGIVDGLFMVFDASRPIWSWAQDLREHRLAIGISHRTQFPVTQRKLHREDLLLFCVYFSFSWVIAKHLQKSWKLFLVNMFLYLVIS